jgi:hypothetical protein
VRLEKGKKMLRKALNILNTWKLRGWIVVVNRERDEKKGTSTTAPPIQAELIYWGSRRAWRAIKIIIIIIIIKKRKKKERERDREDERILFIPYICFFYCILRSSLVLL